MGLPWGRAAPRGTSPNLRHFLGTADSGSLSPWSNSIKLGNGCHCEEPFDSAALRSGQAPRRSNPLLYARLIAPCSNHWTASSSVLLFFKGVKEVLHAERTNNVQVIVQHFE